MSTIYITTEDNARLRLLLLLSPYTDPRQRERELLRRELDRAVIVPASHEQPESIRLGVAFEYEDLVASTIASGCLCLPADVAATPGGISVLSRFGAAVIGCCVGNEVWWAEADRSRRIRIRRICAESEPDLPRDGSEADAAPTETSTEQAQSSLSEAELQPAL